MGAALHSAPDIDLLQRLAVALAIGLIIGIERGWQERDVAEGERALGLRTHALAGLLGGVWGAIARGQGGSGLIALGLAFLVFAIASSVFRLREVRHQRTFGATTIVAAMMAFSLGAFAVLGDSIAASAAGVVTACVLALKPALHSWVKRLTWQELGAATASQAVLLAIAVNTGAKAVLAWFTGGYRIGRGVLLASCAALLFGLIGLEVMLRAFPQWLN